MTCLANSAGGASRRPVWIVVDRIGRRRDLAALAAEPALVTSVATRELARRLARAPGQSAQSRGPFERPGT